MAFAHLVYPGAVHTRLHHSLGSYHLMCNALTELKNKGIEISPEEELSSKVAILLHDVGHGPYSHALENVLINVHHEKLSLQIMQLLNEQFDGKLRTAIEIFTNKYDKPFLHQLISGQLDVDRMDYLIRDSFFTGVSEGVIGYDRIIKMLTVHDGGLMVEEKAIYSTEKFLVSRRLMYWQVYLHKTVLCAEKMLIKIIERAKELISKNIPVNASTPSLDILLHNNEISASIDKYMNTFSLVDDYDLMSTMKNWMFHEDKILSHLCRSIVDRRLLKVELQARPFDEKEIMQLRTQAMKELNISENDTHYFVFTGEATNTTYDPYDERINILFKNGNVKDISQVDNALIHQNLSSPVKKFYICYLKS
jgi:hypothetical protein